MYNTTKKKMKKMETTPPHPPDLITPTSEWHHASCLIHADVNDRIRRWIVKSPSGDGAGLAQKDHLWHSNYSLLSKEEKNKSLLSIPLLFELDCCGVVRCLVLLGRAGEKME